ncbi:hypothetical protein SAMN04487950_4430 [Halogranum rubrum]|uniref:Uncharacterized protein n=1 Tax=Halogranum rubrum TaxID=553466 RepID=A0A1I4JB18_9EURY|nr:hypothetical protein SAMN04487950_4430 [Halogranum rubrum]
MTKYLVPVWSYNLLESISSKKNNNNVQVTDLRKKRLLKALSRPFIVDWSLYVH